jgi:hypothetical protein
MQKLYKHSAHVLILVEKEGVITELLEQDLSKWLHEGILSRHYPPQNKLVNEYNLIIYKIQNHISFGNNCSLLLVERGIEQKL